MSKERPHRVVVELNAKELARLKRAAQKSGVTISHWLRFCIQCFGRSKQEVNLV